MTLDSINCYRCGKPGYTSWVDVTNFGDPEALYVPGEQYCLTEGCTDEDGSRRLVALTVAEMAARADAAFMARHKAMVEDR